MLNKPMSAKVKNDEEKGTNITSHRELEKIFDFILTNKKITIDDDGPITRDTLINMRLQLKKQIVTCNYHLTESETEAIIKYFIDSSYGFDDTTPSLITNNSECCKAAIERDIKSIEYSDYFENDECFRNRIIELVKEKKYVLKTISPEFLKQNYEVALMTIENYPESIDNIDWNYFGERKEELNNLIQAIVKAGKYILSSISDEALYTNHDIIMCSIKNDVNSFKYTDLKTEDDPEIFKYLILHDYFDDFDIDKLQGNHSISSFIDKDIIKYFLKSSLLYDYYSVKRALGKYSSDEEDAYLYIDRISELCYKILTTTAPKISDFEAPLRYYSESVWEGKRLENIDDYNNIFNKICTTLKKAASEHVSFYTATDTLLFLEKMLKALGEEQYNELKSAMFDYFSLCKKEETFDTAFEIARNKISELSAKYIAISKENIKNKWINACYENIKYFYRIKKDNPLIRKLIIEDKQKQIFLKRYNRCENPTLNLLASFFDRYQNEIDNSTIKTMIDGFATGNSKLTNIINPPKGWWKYIRNKEACKLITRLNCKYIKIDDPEVTKCRDLIEYDQEKGKYYSCVHFSDEQLESFAAYERLLSIFKEIKKELMKEIKSIELETTEITDEDIQAYKNKKKGFDKIPFTDEYYEFDYEKITSIVFTNFFWYCLPEEIITPNGILDDANYNLITNYLINNNLVWLNVIEMYFENNTEEDWLEEDTDEVEWSNYRFDELVTKPLLFIDEIVKLADNLNYDVTKFADVQELCKLKEYADDKSIAILGPNVIHELCNSHAYTDGNYEEIIKWAADLVVQMTSRNKSTVPYISGTLNDYHYSIYDPQDEEILLTGIRTDACFKIKGNDNDFLHYCALNKNGFVLKITNSNGEFIARGSGFRNGNCVYINQLRTIYDHGGRGYSGAYAFEKEEIIKVFYTACQDIVNTSQNNPKETNKIDFVFTNAAYAIPKESGNVSPEVMKKFGRYPVDNKNADWEEFKRSTKNLHYPDWDHFTTDFGGYSLVCVASSKKGDNILPNEGDIELYTDNEPVYERIRNKITITDKPNRSDINKINKIEAIFATLTNIKYERINIKDDYAILTGDNWYIIYDKSTNSVIKTGFAVGPYDRNAIEESQAALKVLEENNKEIGTTKRRCKQCIPKQK